MGYDKQRFLNMLAMGMCSKARVGTELPPSVYLAASQWQKEEPKPYIVFTSAEPFTLSKDPRFNGYEPLKCWDGTLYYSTDADTWAEWDGTSISSAMHGTTHRLYMRGLKNTMITGQDPISAKRRRWVLSGSNISCHGNIENLLDYEVVRNSQHPTMASYCYGGLFMDCTSLTTAPELPAISLTEGCYYFMFDGCTSLTTAPELPAKSVPNAAYMYMFTDCTSLTTAPELPATRVYESGYRYMFSGCTSLTAIPKLRGSLLESSCEWMFSDCVNIKVSEVQTEEYETPYHIPAGYTHTGMFYGTGGTFTGTPAVDTTYYLHNSNTVI